MAVPWRAFHLTSLHLLRAGAHVLCPARRCVPVEVGSDPVPLHLLDLGMQNEN